MSFVIGAAGLAVVLALLCWCVAVGFRNGDQATDAEVSAVLRHSGQPDEPRPVVVATVRNPSGTPVLAGLSARRYLLTAVTGQAGDRLRVYRLRLAPAREATVPLGKISPIIPNGRG